MSVLPERLKHLRKKFGYNQRDIAKKLNISQPGYAKYENDLAEPDMDRLITLSKLYGVSTDYLLDNTVDIPESANGQVEPNTITVFGYGGERKDYQLTPEQAKMLEQLAQEMSKNKG